MLLAVIMAKTRANTKCNDKGKGKGKVKDKFAAMARARAGKSSRAMTKAMTRAMTSADNAMTRAMTRAHNDKVMSRFMNDNGKGAKGKGMGKGVRCMADNDQVMSRGNARCMAALNPKGKFMVAVYGTNLAAIHGTSNGTAMVLIHGTALSCASGNDVDDFINGTTKINNIIGGDIVAFGTAFDQVMSKGKDKSKTKVSKVGGKCKDQVTSKGNDQVTSRRFFVRRLIEPPHVGDITWSQRSD